MCYDKALVGTHGGFHRSFLKTPEGTTFTITIPIAAAPNAHSVV